MGHFVVFSVVAGIQPRGLHNANTVFASLPSKHSNHTYWVHNSHSKIWRQIFHKKLQTYLLVKLYFQSIGTDHNMINLSNSLPIVSSPDINLGFSGIDPHFNNCWYLYIYSILNSHRSHSSTDVFYFNLRKAFDTQSYYTQTVTDCRHHRGPLEVISFVLNQPKSTCLSEWFSLLLLTSVFWCTPIKEAYLVLCCFLCMLTIFPWLSPLLNC